LVVIIDLLSSFHRYAPQPLKLVTTRLAIVFEKSKEIIVIAGGLGCLFFWLLMNSVKALKEPFL